jgi:hypothetical protein
MARTKLKSKSGQGGKAPKKTKAGQQQARVQKQADEEMKAREEEEEEEEQSEEEEEEEDEEEEDQKEEAKATSSIFRCKRGTPLPTPPANCQWIMKFAPETEQDVVYRLFDMTTQKPAHADGTPYKKHRWHRGTKAKRLYRRLVTKNTKLICTRSGIRRACVHMANIYQMGLTADAVDRMQEVSETIMHEIFTRARKFMGTCKTLQVSHLMLAVDEVAQRFPIGFLVEDVTEAWEEMLSEEKRVLQQQQKGVKTGAASTARRHQVRADD